MAGNGTALLVVNDFTLSGIDVTNRKTVVTGSVVPGIANGSLLTATIAVAGTGYAANDTSALAGGTGGVIKILTVSSGIPQTISILSNGSGYAAATGAATTNIIGTGSGLTITTTVNSGDIAAITAWAIVSNVLTFTANNSFTTGGGQTVIISGFTGTSFFLNGSYTTSSATATTIVVAKTHANSSGTQQGLATIQATYTTGGIPVSYSFIDGQGNNRPIGTIGPLSVPTWIDVKTAAGSALAYKVNTTVSPNTLVILSGITELSDQASITVDTTVFRAEFPKNSF